jgi:predicted TIM-barrel fold metal-dependent hydrolase
MVIDFHTHIFPPVVKNNREKYLERDFVFRSLYADSKSKLADAEDLIRDMDEQEIDWSVVHNFQWTDTHICHQTNEYIIESVKRYPDRLIGFGMICLDSPQTAIQEIIYCAQNGLRGIGEIRPSPEILKNIPALAPIIQCIISHEMIVCTHSSEPLGHLYLGKGDITPELLYPFISAFPDLKLVCAHWGGGLPFYSMMPEVGKALQNVYFDCAASPYLYRPQIYNQVSSLVGPGHILFGSDYPLLKPRRLIKEIQTLNLNQIIQNQILGINAKTLLGI